MKKLLLILSLFFIFSIPVYAQTSDQDLDLLQRSEMVAEIKKLRAENHGLKELNTEKDKTIELYKQLNTVQEARIVDLKEALLHSKNSESLSDKMENLYKQQLTDYKAENQRLRDENEKLRKSRDRRSLITGIIGAVVGGFIF